MAGLVAILFALASAGPAGATVFQGSTADPPGDGLGPFPSQDVVSAAAVYDDVAGTLTFAIDFAAAPSESQDFLYGGFVWPAGPTDSCDGPRYPQGAVLAGGLAESPYWGVFDAADSVSAAGEGSRTLAGTALTAAGRSDAMAGQRWRCAYVLIEGAGESFYDETAEISLAAPPAPPPPPPPPPAPAPPKRAQLVLPKPAPLTIKRNVWRTLKVKVTNGGTATAGNVRLKLGRAKGVALKPKSGLRKLKAIRAGASKTAAFKVRLRGGSQSWRSG